MITPQVIGLDKDDQTLFGSVMLKKCRSNGIINPNCSGRNWVFPGKRICMCCLPIGGSFVRPWHDWSSKQLLFFYHHDIWWYKIQVVHGLIAVFLCLLYTNQRTNIRTTSNTLSWGWLTTNPLSVRWPWKDRWLADSPWLKRGCWWSRVALNPNMRLAVVSVRRNLPIYRFTKFTIARRAFSP